MRARRAAKTSLACGVRDDASGLIRTAIIEDGQMLSKHLALIAAAGVLFAAVKTSGFRTAFVLSEAPPEVE